MKEILQQVKEDLEKACENLKAANMDHATMLQEALEHYS